jgi:DNA-directed RNA polymerase specialized sigma24 family protein
MTGAYNCLVIDMAGMRRAERRVLRLHAHCGVSVADIAEAFEADPAAVRAALRRARRKYARCSRRLGVG